MTSFQCLYHSRDLLGESPIWHQGDRVLYWIDAIKPGLHRLDPETGHHQFWQMPALIGSIAPRMNGGLVAAIGLGFAFIDIPSGRVDMQKILNDPSSPVHLNDGKCDRQGRFWAGEVSHDKQLHGKLYCFSPDGNVRVMLSDIGLFNGPCWSLDNRYFYYTDYFHDRSIFRCEFNSVTGELSHRKRWWRIPEEDLGIPDGCTVDAEGFLWSAKWDGYRITRYTPEGKIDREFELPIQRPTSLIFGGKQMDTLFITSASQDLGELKPLADNGAGSLYGMRFKEYRGVPEVPFKG